MRWRNVRAKIDGEHHAATTVQMGECPDCGCRAWYLILVPEVEALHAQCSRCGSVFHSPGDEHETAAAVGLAQDAGDVDEVPAAPEEGGHS